jgi:steroid delta-isomerase-like uncharacterized protein
VAELSAEQRIKLQRELVTEHIRAENAHEWPSVYDTFVDSPDAWYDVVPLSTTFSGINGVIEFYQLFNSALPDFHIDVTAEYDTPGCSIREVTISGTHQGEYCGVAPKENPVSFELLALYLFDINEPGKLIAERIYFDNETLLRQMRGEPGAQTGVGLLKRSRP